MNKETLPVDDGTTVDILGHPYTFKCKPEEADGLRRSAKLLNEQLLIVTAGKKLDPSPQNSLEQVIAASINLCHELLCSQERTASLSKRIAERLAAHG